MLVRMVYRLRWSNLVTNITPLSSPLNLTANISNGNIIISWSQVAGATSYDVDINGNVVNVTTATYTFSNGVLNQQNTIKVTAKNAITSSKYNSISSTIPAEVYTSFFNVGDEFEFQLVADSIQNILGTRFTITYDSSQLEVADLCSLTNDIDLSLGVINDTQIKVVEFTAGRIVLILLDNELSAEFSGLINVVLFKSKVNGQITVTYSFN